MRFSDIVLLGSRQQRVPIEVYVYFTLTHCMYYVTLLHSKYSLCTTSVSSSMFQSTRPTILAYVVNDSESDGSSDGRTSASAIYVTHRP